MLFNFFSGYTAGRIFIPVILIYSADLVQLIFNKGLLATHM